MMASLMQKIVSFCSFVIDRSLKDHSTRSIHFHIQKGYGIHAIFQRKFNGTESRIEICMELVEFLNRSTKDIKYIIYKIKPKLELMTKLVVRVHEIGFKVAHKRFT